MMTDRKFFSELGRVAGLVGAEAPLLQRAKARWEEGTSLGREQAARDLRRAAEAARQKPEGRRQSAAARKVEKAFRDRELRSRMKGPSGGGRRVR